MYKRYEKYKDSGIEWIGEVPEHWEMKRIDWVAEYKNKGIDISNIHGNKFFYYSIPVIEETGDGKYENGGNIDSNKIVLEGDEIIISKLNPRKGRVLLTEKKELPIICSTEFVPLKPKNTDKNYLYYFYVTETVKQYISACVQSVTRSHQRARPSDIVKIWSYMPTIEEQKAIANFLDHKTSEIDSLIADKEKLIKKLEEYKQSIITEAVTKGLNPDVKMKDSGIEWIGEVPEHWEIKRLKHLLEFVNIKTDNEDLPYIGLEHIESWTGKYICPEKPSQPENEANLFEPNYVLFGKLRPYLAKALLPDFKGRCTSELLVLRGIDLVPRYLFYNVLSKHFINIVDSSTYGAKMPRASWQFIGNLFQVVPPIDEQKSICAFLDGKIDSIDSLIKDNRNHIDVLQSYRQSLICEAVTGKIDVRDYQPERSEQLA